ncbi:MAG: methionine--tRNA ligase subunit beta [Patescibacteria group bacterium]
MPYIPLNDFEKLDLRVAKIIAAEKLENTDNLLRLELDLGNKEWRQIVSGIAKDYSPEELVGKEIILVANLESKTIKGIESQGMLLAVEDKDKGIVLLVPDKGVEPGLKIS